MGKREIQELESGLSSWALLLPHDDGSDPFHFFEEGYPGLHRRYTAARTEVSKLGLTEQVEATIRDCLTLVQQGRREEAQNLLFDTCGKLREKSGTWDDMRRLYTASNDPQ